MSGTAAGGFRKPEPFTDSSGDPRTAGFELEVGRVAVRDAADALHGRFGGNLKEVNPFVFELQDSELGRLRIERDAELLTSTKYRKALESLSVDFDPDSVASEIERGVDRLASILVPCEVVTDPLPFESFPRVEEIVPVLRELGAKGTDDSLLYAFGLHLNPSAPALDTETTAAYLRSFLLLESWIIDEAGVDITRRHLTSFIDPFPSEFVDILLDPDYPPHGNVFFADCMEHNPTRNRALDLLPLLAEIDKERVLSAIDPDERSLVSPRPAFHYRLPDCRPGDESWSIAAEWNRWWCVETIASDGDLLQRLIARWRETSRGPRIGSTARWTNVVRSFVETELETRGTERG